MPRYPTTPMCDGALLEAAPGGAGMDRARQELPPACFERVMALGT